MDMAKRFWVLIAVGVNVVGRVRPEVGEVASTARNHDGPVQC
jgi:hypothetical protein